MNVALREGADHRKTEFKVRREPSGVEQQVGGFQFGPARLENRPTQNGAIANGRAAQSPAHGSLLIGLIPNFATNAAAAIVA